MDSCPWVFSSFNRSALSRAHEFGPATHKVVVLVHHGIPYRDAAHTRIITAAIAALAGGHEMLGGGSGQLGPRVFAVVPVSPLRLVHVLARTTRVRDVEALACHARAGPAL